MEDEIRSNQGNIDALNITLPEDILVSYYFDNDNNISYLEGSINTIEIKYNFKGHDDCWQEAKFGLKIKYKINIVFDTVGVWINLESEDPEVFNFHLNTHSPDWYEDWSDYQYCLGRKIVEWGIEWLNSNFGLIDHKIEQEISKYLVDTTFAVLRSTQFNNGNTIDHAELDALNNSFLYNGNITVSSNGELIININFMEGENNQYASIIPDPVPEDHQLNFGGFAFLEHNLQRGFAWKNWNEYQRIDAAFNKMIEHGITACRVEARWDKIQRSNEVVLGKTLDQLTDVEIENLMNNGAHEWDVLEYILDKADEKGIIIIMAIGIGHQDRPPGTPQYPNANMAPDNSADFDTENGKYIAVSADDYLYNLSLYSRAVIRRYANRVGYWQVENELNAARFAESFHWWRKGNLWREEQPGGFQDRVWQTLINAVREEDPRSKILHDFHMFNIVERLERWASDLDIVGINFYPNQLFAYPVLGFAIGEYVWATRRVLKGLQMAGKPVWVTETGYPAKTTATAPDPYNVDDDVMFYSEERQHQYITDALNGSVTNGADAFFYFSLTTEEDDGDPNTPSLNKNIRYAGLVRADNSNSEKQALAPFGMQYVDSYPGIGRLRLLNRFEDVNIGGKISLKGEKDFLNSGDTIWVVKKINHIARTELERTNYINKIVKHHDWNNNLEKWKIEDNLFFISHDFEEHNANFQELKPVTISNCLISAQSSQKGVIDFHDPWYVDENGNQPDNFRTVSSPYKPTGSALDTTGGVFLNQSGPNQNWQLPYYSVRAQSEQVITFHGEATTWYFQGWEGDNVQFQHPNQTETAVVFQADNAEARAVYKGHLASNQAGVLATNGQNKLVYTNGTYHLVYADHGEIYYTYSTDDGASWSAEQRLSDGGGNNRSPAIAVDESGNLAVVWQQGQSIWFRLRKNGNWQSPLEVYNMLVAASLGDATPVVAYGMNYFIVLWRDFSDMNGHNLKMKALDAYGYEGDVEVVSGTTGSSQHPTLCFDEGYRFHLAWEENNHIYYSRFDFDGDRERYNYDVSKECLSCNTGYSQNAYPSITTNSGSQRRAQVMWQIYSVAMEAGGIMHAAYDGSGWNYTSFFDNHAEYSYRRPSLRGFPGTTNNNKLQGVWYQDINQAILLAQYDGSSWTVTPTGEYGVNPTLSSNATVEERSKLVYRKYSSVPYLVKSTSQGLYSGTGSQATGSRAAALPMVAYQRQVIGTPQGQLAVEVGPAKWNGEGLALQWEGKTQGRGRVVVFRSGLVDIGVQNRLNYQMRLVADSSISRQWGSDWKGYWELVSVGSEQVVARRSVSLSPGITGEERNVSVTGVSKGYWRFVVEVPTKWQMLEHAITVWYIESGALQGEDIPEPVVTAGATEVQPQHYALFANYPNPFNPATTIRYDIPVPSRVELVVYDVLGREVARLVDGVQGAGRYTVQFQAAGIPSGVYIYRLRAESLDDRGEVFEARRKMLLVK